MDSRRSLTHHPAITGTTHELPFDRLSPRDFERLCLWLVEREGYEQAEHLGAAGSEQGRDIIAWREGRLWAFQCKRVQRFGPRDVLAEADKVLALPERERPVGLVFLVTCDVSANTRQQVRERCAGKMACRFWTGAELDERVKRHPDVVSDFFQSPPPTSVPFQARPLPSHFVPRPEVRNALKTQLLADEVATPGMLIVSAIHGLGGIGKSVSAAALCHDEDVKQRFSDGILWVTLGQQPELLSLLSFWVQALGDYNFRPITVEAASAHLRTLLHDRAVLLVVDDAWQAEHIFPFLVGGSRCRVLITTREAHIVRAVGAAIYGIDVMTPEQSLTLIARRLGRSLVETEPDTARELTAAVGYLPLALELVAAQVADGVPPTELLEGLAGETTRLEALEDIGANEVATSFKDSLQRQ